MSSPRPTARTRPAPTPVSPATLSQRTLQDPAALNPQDVLQLQRLNGNRATARLLAGPPRDPPIQRKNHTGMPDRLKSGIEALSGTSMDRVRVHYNSPRPAGVQALAYTQGTDIHLGRGQEKHLAHEAWHVVQQSQRRAKPTLQRRGKAISDDAGLEREADVMGARAVSGAPPAPSGPVARPSPAAISNAPIQRVKGIKVGTPVEVRDGGPVWYGQVEKDLDTTYDVRVGGTDKTVTVREDKVDLHPSIRAIQTYERFSGEAEAELAQLGVSEHRAQALRQQAKSISYRTGNLERTRRDWSGAISGDIQQKITQELSEQALFIKTLPDMDIDTEKGKFASAGGLADALVQAQEAMDEGTDKETAGHTIAMFNYMATHADDLAGMTDRHFTTIPRDKPVLRNSYLEALSSQMTPKLAGKMVWGDFDRGQIVSEAMTVNYWFSQGKTALLEKADLAQQAGKTLKSLLENHSQNMDAKSYGRRVMSMLILQIEDLPEPLVQVVRPVANTPVPYATAGYEYFGENDYTQQHPLRPDQLEVGKDYLLYLNKKALISVTVSANDSHGQTLTFESVM